MNVVVFGSISVKQLPQEARARLDRILALDAHVLVGDAPGVDTAVQQYLHSRRHTRATVYHRGSAPRHNGGRFPTIAVAGSYTDRDHRMCGDARYGLAIWDGRSKGSARNIQQLGAACRVVRAGRGRERFGRADGSTSAPPRARSFPLETP